MKSCEQCIHFFVCGISKLNNDEAERCIDYLEPVVVLYNIGTEIWYVADGVESAKVTGITVDESGLITYSTGKFHFTNEDIGTDVFLYREEAEASIM